MTPSAHERPVHPSFGEAFRYWLKLGFISFGGPAGQIAMMHQELVEKRRWISEHRFLHALNYCMLLPGPEAQQLAIYIGWLLHRTWGGIVAGTLFLLPSLFILIGLTWVYLAFGDVRFVQGVFAGIKPAVVAIVLFAAWRIGARALKNRVLLAFAAASFLAIFVFDVPFPYIVLAAGMAGYVGGRLDPAKFRVGGGHVASDKDYGPALIDDDTPPPAHARFRAGRLVILIGLFVFLWGAAMLSLPAGTLADMGAFFTKAALVTFGGAYAVLPYVYQGGVEHYGWLTGPQMIDGLALGETTPGPLIMVVAFVGFVGGWSHAIFGPDALFWAGAAGAAVATFFTFLPGYLFILAGAPLVEATHGDIKFVAPLTGITAAVVGVILNLAVFFAWHVFWPQATAAAPFAGAFQPAAVLIAVAAFIALWKYKQDIMRVIGACAAAGLLLTYAGL
ncbi:chromate transporter [Sulfuritortus calidifontis]|uniref:Chromate transporter n=1 Tax=Sulfuritortus calidifontis TaxID=1914471 RepID=A0A4R3JYC4_9PROT|nr:chromate efflux transporter [Sulfuritortus calidifontis]TCS72380.1 chromate transporter [Sulfuritortus calidifontis]